MDLGFCSRYHHLSEEADFSGNDSDTEGYWKVGVKYQFALERESIYVSISTCSPLYMLGYMLDVFRYDFINSSHQP